MELIAHEASSRHPSRRDLMRRMLIRVAGGVVAAASILTSRATAQEPQGNAPTRPIPQIVTTAQAESRLTPDRATIVIGVETHAPTAAQASADNARRQRAVIDTIRALGIGPDQYSTTGYTVFPERTYPQTGDRTPKITGYTVSNMVRVELRRTEQVGPLLDAVLAKGANGINSLQFSASNTDSARRAAMSTAVARARGDAETLARAAGGRVGDLLELTFGGAEPTSPPMPMVRSMAAGAAAETPINPGEQTINVSVTARWSFVPGAGAR
jgi:uncharacterized protein YggE